MSFKLAILNKLINIYSEKKSKLEINRIYKSVYNKEITKSKEIDFLETNGQKMFQHTLHLATAKSGPQRWEVSYTEAANTDCWNWDEMVADTDPGIHILVGKIYQNKPFHMVVDFNSDYTNMIITLSQDSNSVKVFDMTEPAYPASDTLDMSKLKDAQEKVAAAKLRMNTALIDEQSNDGVLKVTITANRELKIIEIDASLLEDKEQLEDDLMCGDAPIHGVDVQPGHARVEQLCALFNSEVDSKCRERALVAFR